jgi:hypothetical protein
MSHLIEFLIPAYKRFDGLLAASLSVAEQMVANGYQDIILISVFDDASPGFNKEYLIDSLGDMAGFISIESNINNKGMSRNIYDMVSNSNAEFCTILTDDDWLIDGKLPEIVAYLRSVENKIEIGGLFTPRYSYLESGELHCVVCKPFSQDHLIESGPITAMKHCHNGFILTGFIFRTIYFAKNEWYDNIENGYFPVINFGIILSRYSVLFVDRNWFHHTVLNLCHWESWGLDQVSQRKRLYMDYMDSVSILARSFVPSFNYRMYQSLVFWYEGINYLRQFRYNEFKFPNQLSGVSNLTRRRLAFNASIIIYPCFISLNFIWRVFLHFIKILNRVVSTRKSNLD